MIESNEPSEAPSGPLDMLMETELPLRILLGSTQLLLEDVLKLGVGSVIELNCSARDLVELVVNERVIARGEVVVVDGYYGFRVSQVLTRSGRLLPDLALRAGYPAAQEHVVAGTQISE